MLRNTHSILLLALVLVCTSAGFADVTIRYKPEVQPNPALLAGSMVSLSPAPPDTVIRLKGSRSFASYGNIQTVTDFEKQTVILLDPSTERFATMPLKDFSEKQADALPEKPAEALAALSRMKPTIDSKVTGRTATIRGVEAQEREVTFSQEVPMPNVPPGPTIRMVIQIWTAKPEGLRESPALSELAAYTERAAENLDPLNMLQKIFGETPGPGGSIFAEMKKDKAVLLRMHIDVYMPGFAALMERTGGKFDASVPVLQMNQEIAELSTESVPDSVFQVPETFKPGTPEELLKSMIKAQLPVR